MGQCGDWIPDSLKKKKKFGEFCHPSGHNQCGHQIPNGLDKKMFGEFYHFTDFIRLEYELVWAYGAQCSHWILDGLDKKN